MVLPRQQNRSQIHVCTAGPTAVIFVVGGALLPLLRNRPRPTLELQRDLEFFSYV